MEEEHSSSRQDLLLLLYKSAHPSSAARCKCPLHIRSSPRIYRHDGADRLGQGPVCPNGLSHFSMHIADSYFGTYLLDGVAVTLVEV